MSFGQLASFGCVACLMALHEIALHRAIKSGQLPQGEAMRARQYALAFFVGMWFLFLCYCMTDAS